jgi:hypothetical protein
MYRKLVGILVMTLLITTALSALGTMNEEEIPVNTGISANPTDNIKIPRKTSSCGFGNMFYQRPWIPDQYWGAPFSDVDLGYISYDDFWNLTAPICDVHWWGFAAIDVGGDWQPCDPTGMTFNITIHEVINGIPGDVVCSYIDIIPHSITSTGLEYVTSAGAIFELLYFEFDLDPCCELSNGWVSVFKTYSPNDCLFAWIKSPYGNGIGWQYEVNLGNWYVIDDLAFVLSDGGEEPIPDLECDGRLHWEKVKPGTNVTGSFNIRNNGDIDSILHCKGDESTIPTWGNWTFSATAGILAVEDGWVTVNVTVIAPEDENEIFTGTLKVVNIMDPTDYCEIDVKLETPRIRTTYNTPLTRLFERFPNAFPILRHLIGYL